MATCYFGYKCFFVTGFVTVLVEGVRSKGEAVVSGVLPKAIADAD